ncbi:MAG TPA: tetratricopeptide repeat protein, partial [Nitrospiria bacterium]|nr:tetratricopeptide repeat protein [Nitrospiria bacterium]
EAYEKAIEKDPGLMEARFELSLIYERDGEFSKAIHEWKKILENDPNDLRAREKLADIYFKGEQYGDAVREYSLLSKLLPNDPKVYLALGESQVMLAATVGSSEGRAQLLAGAAESFQHALDFDPENESAKAYLDRLKKP